MKIGKFGGGKSDLVDVVSDEDGDEKDKDGFKLNSKRALAQGVVGVATVSAVTVGAVPIPFVDAAILSSIEAKEINALARLYEVDKKENSKQLIDSIVEVGTVSDVAKSAINALKVIPGINLAAGAVNAIIAGSFAAAIGEGAVYAFEQVYMGKKTVDDIEWVTGIIESKLSGEFVKKIEMALNQVGDRTDLKIIAKIITKIYKKGKKS